MKTNHTFFVLTLSMTLFPYASSSKAQTEWININGTAAYNGESVDDPHISVVLFSFV